MWNGRLAWQTQLVYFRENGLTCMLQQLGHKPKQLQYDCYNQMKVLSPLQRIG